MPTGLYEYYVYLVDASARSAHSKEVDRFFDNFARQSEVDAVIVRGPKDLSQELLQFLQAHAWADFERLESLFHEVTCLVIAEGALQSTSKPVHVLPVMPHDAQGSEQTELLEALLVSLLRAMREHQLASICSPSELSGWRSSLQVSKDIACV